MSRHVALTSASGIECCGARRVATLRAASEAGEHGNYLIVDRDSPP
jgi:hypothetical protein